MIDQVSPIAGEAQPRAVVNTIDSIVDDAVKESAQESSAPEEPTQEPKELTPAEELEKLRRAKARDDRRIGKITALRYQAQKEADELRAELSKYKQPPQQKTDGAPNEADFTTYSDYLEARAEWKIEQKLAERDSRQQETQRTSQEQNWIAQREQIVEKQANEFVESTPEFKEIIKEYGDFLDELPMDIQKAFLAADNMPLAVFNLAKDGKLEDLASMSLVDAKVEIRLAQMKQIEKPKTKAPTPLPASRGSVPGGRRPEDLSGDEIRSWMRNRS